MVSVHNDPLMLYVRGVHDVFSIVLPVFSWILSKGGSEGETIAEREDIPAFFI